MIIFIETRVFLIEKMFLYKHIDSIEFVKCKLIFKEHTNFTDKSLKGPMDQVCNIFRVSLLNKHKDIGRFSNLL